MAMRLLAIDYGRAYVGLAFSEGILADPMEPLKVTKKEGSLLAKIIQIVESLNVDTVILGLPEGSLVEEIKHFARELEEKTNLKVEFQPEKSSSIMARHAAKAGGKSLKRLGTKEHSLAAGIILEDYLVGQES